VTDSDPVLTPDDLRAAVEAVAGGAGLKELEDTNGPAGESRLAVAVSGGGDSLALALLAAEAFPGRVTGLTVDHGLRPDSAAEAEQVARWLAARDIPHVTLRWEGEKPAANIQAEARAARYRLLDDWCAANGVPAVLTAHHRDDVAETFLMRLERGSGLAGLAAIAPARRLPQGTWLLRPLLDVSRAQLQQVLEARGQAWIEDPSNRNERFARARVRRWLAEQLEPALFAARVAASARHLAAANDAMGWVVQRHVDAHVRAEETAGGLVIDDLRGFLEVPDEIVRRALALCLDRVGTARSAPRGEELERLITALRRGQSATLGGAIVRVTPRRAKILPEGPRARTSARPTAGPGGRSGRQGE